MLVFDTNKCTCTPAIIMSAKKYLDKDKLLHVLVEGREYNRDSEPRQRVYDASGVCVCTGRTPLSTSDASLSRTTRRRRAWALTGEQRFPLGTAARLFMCTLTSTLPVMLRVSLLHAEAAADND